MSICAIVPIKHNSERVPGKNYRDFNGQPLFHVILKTLLQCKDISKVVVDTNSRVVKDSINTHFCLDKIQIYDRPLHLHSGDTPTNVLLENVITELKLDSQFDIFLQTHATNPLLTVNTIQDCISTFLRVKKEEGYDCLFTVKKHQTRLYHYGDGSGNGGSGSGDSGEGGDEGEGRRVLALNHNPKELLPTQDLKPLYEENSCLYLFTRNGLFKHHHRIGEKPYMFTMTDIESLHRQHKLFANNTVIITGVNGDIGQSIAKQFKLFNWKVIGLDIVKDTDQTYLDHFQCCDISKPEALKSVIDGLQLTSVDCIVNNAAIQICKPLWELEVDEWDYTFQCNVRPAYLLVKYTLDLLKKSSNPNVINIGSVHATNTSNNISAYACSKAAIVGLTKNMALELSAFNIRVNSISPGAIDTKMLRSGLMRGHVESGTEEDMIQNLADKHILHQVGSPCNVAEFVFYVISNRFITGSNLIMDGGATIKLSTE